MPKFGNAAHFLKIVGFAFKGSHCNRARAISQLESRHHCPWKQSDQRNGLCVRAPRDHRCKSRRLCFRDTETKLGSPQFWSPLPTLESCCQQSAHPMRTPQAYGVRGSRVEGKKPKETYQSQNKTIRYNTYSPPPPPSPATPQGSL